LISPYAQATAWLHGADPYSPYSLFEFWPSQALSSRPAEQEFFNGTVLVEHGIPTAYPLTCFVLLAPFALFSWMFTKVLLVTLSTALLVAAVCCLVSLNNLRGWRRTTFVALALMLAPFHTGIATCNLAIITVELGIIAVWASASGAPVCSGLLLALSVGLKPQVGLCFLLLFLVRRKWRSSVFSVTAILALAGIGVLRLATAHVNWTTSYALDNRALLNSGVLGDFTERNPLRFGLVNLQVAIYPLVHSRSAANVIAAALAIGLTARFFALLAKRQCGDELLCLNALVVLSLLPIYHRFYDAALLIVPLSWLVARLEPRPSVSIGLGALSVSCFFAPGGTLLQALRDRGMLAHELTTTAAWDSFGMAVAVWCLLLLAVIFLHQLSRSEGPGSPFREALSSQLTRAEPRRESARFP